MNELEKISHETMVFMRGKYRLDEIGDGYVAAKGICECRSCSEHPCIRATSADYRSMIHTEVHDADEITWGILPYVPWQYEK